MLNIIQNQLAHRTIRAEAEPQRADDNRTLLDEHRVLFARMAAVPQTSTTPFPAPTLNTIKAPDPPPSPRADPSAVYSVPS